MNHLLTGPEDKDLHSKANPRSNVPYKKYKQQMAWRIDKVRQLLARGHSQDSISRELIVSQSTISRDIKLVRAQSTHPFDEHGNLTAEQTADLSLGVDELILNLWKIIDDSRTTPKLRIKAHLAMKEYYHLKIRLLAEGSTIQKNRADAGRTDLDIHNSLSRRWTKRILDKRLKHYFKIGFVASHFEMIDTLQSVQRILVRALNEESMKEGTGTEKNSKTMSRLSTSIAKNIQTLRILLLDTPYIDKIRKELAKEVESEKPSNKKIKKQVVPSSAAVVPEGYFNEKITDDEQDDDPVF